jgi:hypothetical protein
LLNLVGTIGYHAHVPEDSSDALLLTPDQLHEQELKVEQGLPIYFVTDQPTAYSVNTLTRAYSVKFLSKVKAASRFSRSMTAKLVASV